MLYEVTYMYRGVKAGVIIDGNPVEIRSKMKAEKKTVLSIKKRRTFFQRGATTEDKIVFFESLGDQIRAGIPISQALDSVAVSLEKTAVIKPIIQNISASVKEGKPLSAALESYEPVFGRTTVAMVYASENTGQLGDTLLTVGEYIQNMAELMSKMKKELTYPLTTLVVGLSALMFFSKFVLPRIFNSGMMKAGGKDKTVDSAVAALQMIGAVTPYVFLAVLLTALGLWIVYKHNQEKAERLLVRIPGVRELVFYRAYFVAFSAMSKLTASGVPLESTIKIVANSTNMILVKREFEAAHAALKHEGTSFAKKLKSLTAVERNMLEMAMNSARQVKGFEKIANRFYKLYLKKVAAIGPKLYMGTMVVGFMVVILMMTAIMLPNLKMLSTMGGVPHR